MVFQIEFSKTAEKELDKLEKDISVRILKKLREIKDDPYSYIKRLVGSQLFSLRVGDYRLLLILTKDKIFVVRVGHRSKVYD